MRRKPKCIIVTGRPGAGKTTLSKRLGDRLWMPVISRDTIKEGFVNTHGIKHDRLPPDTNALVTNFFFDIVDRYLAATVSIIIEAAFQHKVWEPRMSRISELASPYILLCSIDGEIAAKRHLQRGLDEPVREFYHGDQRVATYRETGIVSPPGAYIEPALRVPTIHVSTDGEYSPCLDEIVKYIQSEAQQ